MKFLVIGGGAAGMAAVSKAKRLDRNISATVVEGGSFVSYAECGRLNRLFSYPDRFNDSGLFHVFHFSREDVDAVCLLPLCMLASDLYQDVNRVKASVF